MRSLRFPHFWSCLTWQVVLSHSMRWGLKSIAHQIHTAGADYILSLKSNHPTLFQQVEQWFQQMQADGSLPTPREHTTESGHHRIDTRTVWTLGGLVCCPLSADAWAGLQSIIVERTRRLWNKTTLRCSSTSAVCRRSPKMPLPFAPALGIENGLHWILDVTFGEDACRVRSPCTPQSGTVTSLLPSMRSIEPAQANKASGRSSSGQWMIALCCGCWQPHCPTPTKTKILAVNSF